MGRGERNRRGPVTIWSPEPRRRRVPRRGARVLRRQLARAQERERREQGLTERRTRWPLGV